MRKGEAPAGGVIKRPWPWSGCALAGAGLAAAMAAGQCTPHCRRRKVRSAPFPPGGENCARSLAPPLSTARGAVGAPGLVLRKDCARRRVSEANRRIAAALRPETNGPHPQGVRRIRKRQSRQRLRSGRSKRKKRCGGSVRAERIPPAAGGGWLAVPRFGFIKRDALGETSSPGRSGIHSAPVFAAAGPVVDGRLRNGPMRASAPTTAQGARSEAERAEREAGQMRSCTPALSVPSATGRQSQKSQKTQACPKASPNRSRHRYVDPRRTRRATAPERA